MALSVAGAMLALGRPAEDGALLWTAAVAAFAAGAWALLDLERFVLVGVFAAMTFPQALVSPAGALVAAADLMLVLALGAWLAYSAVQAGRPLALTGNPLLVPGLLFAGATAASAVWSVDTGASVKQAVQITEIVVVIPLVFASLPSSLGRIRQGLVSYVALTSGLALVTFLLWLPRAAAGDPSAQYLPGLHKNATGSFLGVGLVLAYTLWLRADSRRGWLGLAVLVEVLGLIATVSRGSLAGAAVAVLVVSALMRRRRLATLVLSATAAAVFVVAVQQQLSDQLRIAGGYGTNVVRYLSYARGWDYIREHWLLGTGAGTYWDYIPELQIGLADPNNVFLLTWAELGLAGLAALVFVLWRYGRTFVGARLAPRPVSTLALAAGGAALSLFVHFQVDSTWTRGTASICFALVGLMIAALRLAPQPVAGVAIAAAPAGAAPKRLRAVHVVSSEAFAGIERHVLGLVRGLRGRGVDAAIACPPGAERLRAEARAAGVPVLTLDELQSLSDPPEIVHAHDGRAAIAAWHLTSLGRTRLVRTQHFVTPASAVRGGWRRAVSLAVHRALNADVAALVAVSDSVAGAARARREAAPAKLAVIPPGVELPTDEQVAAAHESRGKLPHPVFAFVGRLEAEKSLPTLLAAAALVAERLPDATLVVAGAGSREQELRELAATLGINAEFPGEVADAAEVFARAHVFVNPGAVEGFGLVTAEAAAWELPVVAVSSGGSAEVVEDGVTGLLVEPGDHSALADAIVRLLSDRELAARLGAAGRRRVRERFGLERTVALTEALYERVHRSGRP